MPKDPSIHDSRTRCEHYLSLLYPNAPKKHLTHSLPETYGEILAPSISKLIENVPISETDTFVDLGSGLGKVVIQIFLQTKVKTARGIEILSPLHEQAHHAAQKTKKDFPTHFQNHRQLAFTQDDFLTTPLQDATLLLIGSPCYTPAMLDKLSHRINHLPQIHTVLTLRPLIRIRNLPFRRALTLEGSWDTTLCYIYSANPL